MAPAALGEAPSAVNTNGPDGAVVEETHPKDPVAGEGALPDEPDKENVFGRHEDAEFGAQSTIPDDLFDDDSDEDDVNEFVPRGKGAKPTEAQATPKPVRPVRKPTDATSQAAAGKGLGAAATTEKQKDAKAQKKDSKVTK